MKTYILSYSPSRIEPKIGIDKPTSIRHHERGQRFGTLLKECDVRRRGRGIMTLEQNKQAESADGRHRIKRDNDVLLAA